jgi:hypothetical protein
VYDDGIDIDQVVRHDFFCEFADEMVKEEILNKAFPLAEKTLVQMLIDKVAWLNDAFIDSYQNKYNGISISKVDQVSLLMKEAVTCYDDRSVYDIFNTVIDTEYFSFRSMIYLLNKAVFYAQSYLYPYKIFSHLEKKAHYSVDYHLLADSLAVMSAKHNVVNPGAVKRLLDRSREKMYSDYEKLSLAFSYQRNGYSQEAKEIFESTIDVIVSEIQEGKKEYQAIRSLILMLVENGDIGDESSFFCDLENDGSIFIGNGREVCFSWDVKLVKTLYGAFDDEN